MIQKYFLVVLGSFLLLGTRMLYAQETLDPVTVASSLTKQRSSETGRNITIIQGEALATLPVHSVDELLKYIPGVEAQMRGPQGAQTDISIRGSTFQQILVILDGLRLNDPNTGHFTGYVPISPAEIERIEVLKGASAAIYGSDAVGGVINIVTKTFSNTQQKEKTNVHAQLGAGEYGLFTVNAGGFYQNEKVNIGAGIISNNATGVLQRGIRGYFHNTSASAGVQVKFNPYWNASYRIAYDNRDFAAQNFYTTFSSDTASEKVNSLWQQARVQYEKNKTILRLDAGYKSLDDEYFFNPSSLPNNNKSHLLQSNIIWQQQLTDAITTVTGLNFQNRDIQSNDRGNHHINIVAPFISYIQKIGNNFTINPSLRLEVFGHLKAEWVPQVSTSYKWYNMQFRASGGKTIRNADFTELYNNYNKALVKSGSIGNPFLMTEKSWNYEGGIDWFYKAGLKISGSFFQSFHTKLIDWVNTPYVDMPRKDNLNPGSTYALAKNVATVNTTGGELDISFVKKFSMHHSIQMQGGILWLYSSSSEVNPSFYLLSHAKFLSNFLIAYTIGNVAVSLTGVYKKRNSQTAPALNAFISKDYFLMNTKFSYNILKNRVGAFVQADNVFDRKYSDLLGAVMPGRWLQGGIIFNLKQ